MCHGVECYLLSRVRLCNPTDCSLPGSSIHGIPQARILEWISIPFSRGSSRPYLSYLSKKKPCLGSAPIAFTEDTAMQSEHFGCTQNRHIQNSCHRYFYQGVPLWDVFSRKLRVYFTGADISPSLSLKIQLWNASIRPLH